MFIDAPYFCSSVLLRFVDEIDELSPLLEVQVPALLAFTPVCSERCRRT
jgi:hypothetical protein